jgi:hypothetical protein
MRSGRSWFLASLLTFSLAAFASGCASPLDEPLGSQTSALRRVTDEELADLPGCDAYTGIDAAGGEVLPTDHDDLYAVSVNNQLLCADSGVGVTEMQRRGIGATDITPVGGTPLPARSDAPTGSSSDDGTVLQGTPLPAKR